MIAWLHKALVLAMHDRQIAEHGGRPGVRDEALLEAALARPQQLHACGNPPPDLAGLAAALACRVSHDHPFVDGNKRVAAVCCETFIELNGASLEADDADLYAQYLSLAEGNVSERDFTAWLRERIRSLPKGEAHESRKRYRKRKAQVT